jgi:hypothetical protein
MEIINGVGIPGTLGCIAWSYLENERVFLTNHHVLFGGGSKGGEKVWQLNREITGNSFIELGTSLYGKMDIVDYEGRQYYIDSAVGLPGMKSPLNSRDSPRYYNNSLTTAKATIGARVFKLGAASQLTEGIVTDIEYPDVAYIRERFCNAPNQILISPAHSTNSSSAFSTAGDSGSVVFNSEGKIIGLLWGHNERGEGIACHIGPILNEFKLAIPAKVSWWERLKLLFKR